MQITLITLMHDYRWENFNVIFFDLTSTSPPPPPHANPLQSPPLPSPAVFEFSESFGAYFYSWVERHCESKLLCLKKQCNVLRRGLSRIDRCEVQGSSRQLPGTRHHMMSHAWLNLWPFTFRLEENLFVLSVLKIWSWFWPETSISLQTCQIERDLYHLCFPSALFY